MEKLRIRILELDDANMWANKTLWQIDKNKNPNISIALRFNEMQRNRITFSNNCTIVM